MKHKISFLPDEHQFAIAAVAIRGGTLDTTIEYLVQAALTNLPETARYALKNLGSDRMVGLAKAALNDSFPDEVAEIAAVFERLGRARSERNEIIHWYWGEHKSDAALAEMARIRPFRPVDRRAVSASQIYAIASNLFEVEAAVFDWFMRFRPFEPDPSPDKSEPLVLLESSPAYTGFGLLGTSPPPGDPQEPSQA